MSGFQFFKEETFSKARRYFTRQFWTPFRSRDSPLSTIPLYFHHQTLGGITFSVHHLRVLLFWDKCSISFSVFPSLRLHSYSQTPFYFPSIDCFFYQLVYVFHIDFLLERQMLLSSKDCQPKVSQSGFSTSLSSL